MIVVQFLCGWERAQHRLAEIVCVHAACVVLDFLVLGAARPAQRHWPEETRLHIGAQGLHAAALA